MSEWLFPGQPLIFQFNVFRAQSFPMQLLILCRSIYIEAVAQIDMDKRGRWEKLHFVSPHNVG